MDDTRFDELAKRLGAGLRRREALRLLAGGALGTAFGLLGGDALAQEEDAEDGVVEEAGKGKNRNNKLKARRCRKRNNRRRNNTTPPPVVSPPPPPPPTCAALSNLCSLEVCCSGAAACESACFVGAGTFYCSPRVCCVRTGKACTNSAQCCGGRSQCVSGVCS